MFLHRQQTPLCASYIYRGYFLDVRSSPQGVTVTETLADGTAIMELVTAVTLEQALEHATTLLDLRIVRTPSNSHLIEAQAQPLKVELREAFSQAKGAADNEDGIFIGANCFAVVDGASPKSSHTIEGKTPGAFARDVLIQALGQVGPTTTPEQVVTQLTKALATATLTAYGVSATYIDPHLRPTASAAIFLPARSELVLVGDAQALIDGTHFQFGQKVDLVAAEVRSCVIAALGNGHPRVQVIAREAIAPLLKFGTSLRNKSGVAGFSAFDGTPISPKLIRVLRIPQTTKELVLASDGYPTLLPTWAETEANLQNLIAEDPLCIEALRGVKGVMPGNSSYDDRAYVRLVLKSF